MNSPRFLPPVFVTTLVTLLLALHWWLGVSATRETCTTSDELAHLTGGFSYWRFNDYRLQPENGNLPQRLAALPWVAGGARMDTTDPAWARSNVWIIGHRFFFGSGNNTDYLLLLTRATMALLGVALGWLIFAWSRRLWGDAGGLFSLGLYALCPNFLAHGPLATSDVAMTLVLLAASGAFWRQTRRLDRKTWALSAGLLAVASVTKFSWVLLLPIGALLIVVRLVSTEPLTVGLGRERAIGRRGAERGDRLVIPAQQIERNPERIQENGVVRHQSQSLARHAHGFARLPENTISFGQSHIEAGGGLRPLQASLEDVSGARSIAGFTIDPTELLVSSRVFRREFDGTLVEPPTVVPVLRLVIDRSQHEQAVDVVT